ncbi:MAG: PH domain-containing protein [Acidobacteria bacterium Pan2503]|uniref:PH domain-containing protein n=1 Tax=Candidatus Acidiferrum panamense TaxID=2741543 RepID=A0A7V8SW26_9BACT|nr:PH domain-containing protein [Candidatus Acidoferrum panamensis]
MSYVEKHLIPGESIQYQTKLHWIVMLGHTVIAMALALLAVAIPTVWASLGIKARGHSIPGAVYFGVLVCFAVAGALFFIGILRRNATEMAVTSKRVIVKTGIAERRTVEILLSRIESVAVDEPALGRLLGYGTVIVRGTGGTPEMFEKIYHPLEFREQVQRQIAGWAKPA